MIRRAIASSLLVLSASVGFGQALTPSETEVDQAFKNLRSAPQALFRLQGTDYIGTLGSPRPEDGTR
jgi:hypothetical protein